MTSRRTGRDPAEDEDDDSECDQYVDDFSHIHVCSLCLTMREWRNVTSGHISHLPGPIIFITY